MLEADKFQALRFRHALIVTIPQHRSSKAELIQCFPHVLDEVLHVSSKEKMGFIQNYDVVAIVGEVRSPLSHRLPDWSVKSAVDGAPLIIEVEDEFGPCRHPLTPSYAKSEERDCKYAECLKSLELQGENPGQHASTSGARNS